MEILRVLDVPFDGKQKKPIQHLLLHDSDDIVSRLRSLPPQDVNAARVFDIFKQGPNEGFAVWDRRRDSIAQYLHESYTEFEYQGAVFQDYSRLRPSADPRELSSQWQQLLRRKINAQRITTATDLEPDIPFKGKYCTSNASLACLHDGQDRVLGTRWFSLSLT